MARNKDARSSKEKIVSAMKKDVKKPLTMANFSFKKVFVGDWKSFAIFVLLMFMAWSYSHDTAACRDLMENIDEVCLERAIQIQNANSSGLQINISGDNFGRGDREDSWTINQSGSPDIVQRDS